MDRAEALTVLHEIAIASQDSIYITSVSLLKSIAPYSFEIKIKSEGNPSPWNCVKPVLQKHGLKIRFADGFVIISDGFESETVSESSVASLSEN